MVERKLTFVEAKAEAIRGEMRRDKRIIIWGSDVRVGLGGLGGPEFLREFGPRRIFDAPVSENAMIGLAVGASMLGYRPIVDLLVSNFATLAFDQIVNQASRVRYLFGGQVTTPMVIHISMLTVAAGSSHHTDRTYPMLMNVPGLKIICPSTPRNAKGLWTTALRDRDPVVIYESMALSVSREVTPDGDFALPFGQAEIVREGSDVTLVTIFTRGACIAAAAELEKKGISVEIIDPRTLVPFDLDTILTSIQKTGILVIADLANERNSAASQISALVAEHGYHLLSGPIIRICTPNVHIPHARPLEKRIFPTAARICKVLEATVNRSPKRS